MTTHGPIFTGTALIAAVICAAVMGLAWLAGWFCAQCRKMDCAAEDLIKALDGDL